MPPTDAMNLVMIMNHAARFGMAAQVENLALLRDYARSRLEGSRPSQDCSEKVTSNTRFVVLEPGQVKTRSSRRLFNKPCWMMIR